MFPESRFWRVRGSAKVEDTFGGCASLILFIIVSVLFCLKMIDVLEDCDDVQTVTTNFDVDDELVAKLMG